MSITDLQESASNKKLIVVFGAGSSISLANKNNPAKNWKKLIESSLLHSNNRGFITETQYTRQISILNESDDVDELLGVAEFSAKKLKNSAGFQDWMSREFANLSITDGAMANSLRSLEGRGIPLATLNYDTLIEAATGLQAIDISKKDQSFQWARRELAGVLHLHGVWRNPEECIFGIRDYERTINDEVRDLIQRSLTALNRILFVGCGDTFADPNFTNLISWLRANAVGAMPKHYALVRKDEYDKKLKDPYWRGFVDPLAYGNNHDDLPAFLLSAFPTLKSQAEPERKQLIDAGRSSHVLDSYKNFLVRDCGEMTLEGVRADIDTAQRKFNLEKLFVPIDLKPTQPFFPRNDPKREEKLQKWREENDRSYPFEKIFSKHRRFTLLALPGGGKTMLLKRLTVAYSSSARRIDGADKLPEMDLVPVIIKCREWKDNITKPIPAIIKSMQETLGEDTLDGLYAALEPRLKKGTVLLLVDGLDEIHDAGHRLTFVDNLEKFIETYPDIRLILTSREAGFDLVAPTLGRFCEKYSIAPLNAKAVKLLCSHWHGLMSTIPLEAKTEAEEISDQILKSPSLTKLAENPLLLTMLLVVKHGDGKLPPDRVNLYQRAVEVLLDTWNIKGHAALNPKEAVPQLSCIAFEMLRQGKQTATEDEIVDMISKSRDHIISIGRYAKDSPADFLKRVELRSSLLVEGGHQIDNGRLVPFYQFRHLTFQEYLAAEAIVEGNTISAEENADLIDELGQELVREKWKEVVPMVAVLLGRRAKPLLKMLLASAQHPQEQVDRVASELDDSEFIISGSPGSAAPRIIHCMIEEAQFPVDIIEDCCEVVIKHLLDVFSKEGLVISLCQSIYGNDLRDACWKLFKNCESDSRDIFLLCSMFEAASYNKSYWLTPGNENTVFEELTSNFEESRIRATLAVCGAFWLYRSKTLVSKSIRIMSAIEDNIYSDSVKLGSISAWSWGFWRHINLGEKRRKSPPIPTDRTISMLAKKYIDVGINQYLDFTAAISTLKNVGRSSVDVELSDSDWEIIEGNIFNKDQREGRSLSSLRLCYIAKDKYSDAQIIEWINKMEITSMGKRDIVDIFGHFDIDMKISPRKRRNQSGDLRPES